MSGLCDHCTQGSLLDGTPAGAMQGSAYFTPGTQTNDTPKACLVLLTDAFGLPVTNCKLIADEMAKRVGYDVWIPDIFNGSPPLKPHQLVDLLPEKPRQKMSFFNLVKAVLTIIGRLPQLLRNRPGKVDKRVNLFMEDLKSKGYQTIGAFGYCLGGATAARLASTKYIDSAVVCHPAPISKAQINAIRVPTAFVCAEEDRTFQPLYAKKCEALLAARTSNKVAYEFKVYEGVVHGFAARPKLTIPEHKVAFEAALEQTSQWFIKTLNVTT